MSIAYKLIKQIIIRKTFNSTLLYKMFYFVNKINFNLIKIT